MIELSVLIVNYNSWRLCYGAVRSLLAHAPTGPDGQPMPFEVIVVDNASPEADADAQAALRELLATHGGKLIMHDRNGGYGAGMNLAFAHSRGRWVLISNPDVLFKAGCVDDLLRYLEAYPDAGAAAPIGFWDEGLDGRLPPNILPTLADLLGVTLAGVSPRFVARYSRRRTRAALAVWDATAPVDLDMLSGCCFLMRRADIDAVGLFDERFPLYYEDTDLSVRLAKAGKRIVQVPNAHLVHLYNRSGQTAGGLAMERYWISRRAYYRKWYGPPGGWLVDLSRWFAGTRLARRLARRPAWAIHELGASAAKPVIELPAARPRFLVEISLDPRFFLAVGTFGAGSTWTPSDSLWRNFGPTTYFFRVCDLSDGVPRSLGVYRFERIYSEEMMRPVPFADEQPVVAEPPDLR